MLLRTSNRGSFFLCQVFSSFLIPFARIHPRPVLVFCSGSTAQFPTLDRFAPLHLAIFGVFDDEFVFVELELNVKVKL